MKIFQIIKDLRQWRRGRYDAKLKSVIAELAENQFPHSNQSIQRTTYVMGVRDGLEHRKVILKRVKI